MHLEEVLDISRGLSEAIPPVPVPHAARGPRRGPRGLIGLIDLVVRDAMCHGAGIPPGCLIFSFSLSGGLAALDTPANFCDRSAVGRALPVSRSFEIFRIEVNASVPRSRLVSTRTALRFQSTPEGCQTLAGG